jgi:hypothetical protein
MKANEKKLLLVGAGVVVIGGVAVVLLGRKAATAAPPTAPTGQQLPPVAVGPKVSPSPSTIGPIDNPKSTAAHVGSSTGWTLATGNHQYAAGSLIRLSFPATVTKTEIDELVAGVKSGQATLTHMTIYPPGTRPADWPAGDPNPNGYHAEAVLTAAQVVATSGDTFNAPTTGLWGSTAWMIPQGNVKPVAVHFH